MNNLDDLLKTALDVSVSIVVRRTALRKIRTAKKSLELTNAVIKLVQNMEDEGLQRDCLKIAGDMAIYQSCDVIFPITQGKGMNGRYAVQALGKIGGTKAYHYLLNIDNDKGVNSYDAKRAMREIERKEPNIKVLINDELEEIQDSINEFKQSTIRAMENARKAPTSDPVKIQSDSVKLKSDPIDLVSDSDFEESLERSASIELMSSDLENQKLRKSLEQMKQNYIASENLRGEQEKLFLEEQKLNASLQENLNLQQQSSSKDQSKVISDLQKEIDKLQKDLSQTNDTFLKERKRWVEEKEKLNKERIEFSAQKASPKSKKDGLQVDALQKRVEGQQIIIDKLQGELEKKLNFSSTKKRFKSTEEKSNNIGCIVGGIIAFIFFMTCR
ncbi:hypothetical protein PQO01_00170 [Lentisphaera marina]|uniref:hypothetical protein n=1 Tax=Lentisphaera marina TaxID=1111041 RepID=UPI0023661077|nr:hypothetical protein [Lentisphaera marina]MDD7983367.1 hypothetical protein [Lentisphaera marina]